MKVLWSSTYYKIEGNYFKRKIWVLYKLTIRIGGKGSEIIVLLISVTTLTSGISTHATTLVSLSVQVFPKISYEKISFDETSLGESTVIR